MVWGGNAKARVGCSLLPSLFPVSLQYICSVVKKTASEKASRIRSSPEVMRDSHFALNPVRAIVHHFPPNEAAAILKPCPVSCVYSPSAVVFGHLRPRGSERLRNTKLAGIDDVCARVKKITEDHPALLGLAASLVSAILF